MSRLLERARDLMAKPGAWLSAEGGAYALRLSPDRRSRISLTLTETEFRALIDQPGLRVRPGGGWSGRAQPDPTPSPTHSPHPSGCRAHRCLPCVGHVGLP